MQVEQPLLWHRMLVGDLFEAKLNLLQTARTIRAKLKVPEEKGSKIGRKRKAFQLRTSSAMDESPQSVMFFGMDNAQQPYVFDGVAPRQPSKDGIKKKPSPLGLALAPSISESASTSSTSGSLGLSLSPFELTLPEPKSCPSPPHGVLEEHLHLPYGVANKSSPPVIFSVLSPQHKGKENMRQLRVDTTQPEDDFAAQQLVQMQMTPPSLPRKRCVDPRSLSPAFGDHTMLELLAKTCCQEKPKAMSFFSFDDDEACSPLLKRFKAESEVDKFDSLLQIASIASINETEFKTPVRQSKKGENRVERVSGSTTKRQRNQKVC